MLPGTDTFRGESEMTIAKLMIASALGTSLIILSPTQEAQAGKAGLFVGGVAAGAAGAIIGHKIYKHQKRKKARRYYSAPKKRYSSTRKSTGLSAQQRAENADIQNRLNLLGYNAGTPDGILGRNSRAAIRSFQADNGLPITGRLTNPQTALLYQQSGPLLAGNQPTVSTVAAAPVAAAGAAGGAAAAVVAPTVVQTPAPAVVPNVTVASTAPTEEVSSTLSQPTAPVAPAQPTNGFSETPEVLGLSVNSSFSNALANLKNEGFANCETSDNTISCGRTTSFGSDNVTVASVDNSIHTITRVLSFEEPISRENVLGRMPESYKPLIHSQTNTIAASPACGALLSAQPDSFDQLSQQSAQGGKFDANSTAFSHACKYYYSMSIGDTARVSDVELVFFDSTPILASMNKGNTVASSGKTKDEIKF